MSPTARVNHVCVSTHRIVKSRGPQPGNPAWPSRDSPLV